MRFSKIAAVAAAASVAEAQRPTNTSICDYYTTALLKNNTAANQLTILTLVVNTAVIGNYTKPNIAGVTWPDVSVPGILANGTVNGTSVSLLQYFDGSLASTNQNGMAVSMSFLDGGAAEPLMMNMPAWANATSSNQYMLLTHLYQFFGSALGCSQQGMSNTYPAYQGVPSMYEVHKFMALDYAQNTYFIEQVALSAKSFGVAESDIAAVGMILNNYFNVRCAAPMTLIPASAGPVLESICITSDCPIAANASCSQYAAVVNPSAANSTNMMNGTMSSNGTSSGGSGSSGSGSGSGTSSGGTTSSTGSSGAASTQVAGGLAAGVLAVAAMLL